MSTQSVPNFVLLDTDHHRIPAFLADWVPGFDQTPEYAALTDRDRADPAAVCIVLARLLMRLQGEDLTGSLADSDAAILKNIYQALEKLARRPEASIRDAVASGVLGTLQRTANSQIRVFVRSELGPRSRALYEQATG